MSDNAISAQGTTIKIGSGSPTTYNTIPEISTFNGPGGNASVIDVTDLSSTAKEKLVGLRDEGQLSFEMNYIPDNTYHAALRTARANKALTPFKISFVDTGTTEWTFNAYVLGFVISGGVDAPYKASVTLEITGAITEA